MEVNWRSILAFLSLKETDKMDVLGSMSVPDWVDLMCMCLIEGERQEGNDISKTIAEEVFKLHPNEVIEAVSKFIEIYGAQSTPKLPDGPKKD